MRRSLIIIGVLGAMAATAYWALVDQTDSPPFELQGEIPGRGAAFANAMFQSVRAEMKPGHQLEVIDNGAVFEAMAEEIVASRQSVHIVMYIWEKGRASEQILSALSRRDRSVACRVIADDLGSPKFDEDLRQPLEAVGCEVFIFRPMPKYEEVFRNHRKIVVIDGKVAFIGGFGVRDDWLGDGLKPEEWRDVSVRFRGPSVVIAQQAFAENWQESGGQLLPADTFVFDQRAAGTSTAAFIAISSSPVVTQGARITQVMIAAATKRLWIANAYMMSPPPILDRLMAKARAGVDVRLLVPDKQSDSKLSWASLKKNYGKLRESGVRIFEYKPSMMHAKTMLVDDNLASIGSLNLDPLALNTLEEDLLVFEDAALNQDMAERFERDCTHAQELE